MTEWTQFTEFGGPLPAARPVEPQGQPRGDAHYPVPHKAQFAGLATNPAHSYLATFDEAVWSSRENAYRMRLDPVIDACMRLRAYPTALLTSHVVPDDPEDEFEVQCAEKAQALLSRMPRFVFMKRWLLEGIFVGRSAIKTRWQWVNKHDKLWMLPTAFEPVAGDKLVFRLDGAVGIRVGAQFHGPTEMADWSRVYYLTPEEREQLVLHQFEPSDSDFFRPQTAGAIYGLGLRDKLYWLWALKVRVWGMGMDFLQWFAKGVTAYYFEHGNNAHYEAVRAWCEGQDGSSAILFPRMKDGGPGYKPIERFEASTASPAFIQQLITAYFDDLIRQIIVGQTLTSGTAPTGLGSGVAAAHQTTFDQIVKYDSVALGETISTDLLGPFYRANWPGVTPGHWVLDIDNPNAQQMIESAQTIYQMGGAINEDALLESAGLPPVEPGDTILSNIQPMQPASADQPVTGVPEQVPPAQGPVQMSRQRYGEIVRAARSSPRTALWLGQNLGRIRLR